MQLNKECKNCGKKIGHEGSTFMESRMYVVVDEQVQRATIMNKDDRLCAVCTEAVTYYRRIE